MDSLVVDVGGGSRDVRIADLAAALSSGRHVASRPPLSFLCRMLVLHRSRRVCAVEASARVPVQEHADVPQDGRGQAASA